MNVRLFVSGCVYGAAICLALSRASDAAMPHIAGTLSAAQPVDLVVKLPLRNAEELEALTAAVSDPQSPEFGHFLSVPQFRARFAPLPATIARAQAALDASGLPVTRIESQLLHVAAPAGAVERALGVRLNFARDAAGRLRVAAAARPAVPPALAALHASIVGLDDRTAPQPQARMTGPVAGNRLSPHGYYYFDDLKEAYGYPAYHAYDGRGVTIATVGAGDFSDGDAALDFGQERLGGQNALAPAPVLRHVLLGGAPFDPSSGYSQEANLDVQQAGGSAPGATVVGVAVPFGDEGFLSGFAEIDELNAFDIVSTSYGLCELLYTRAYNDGIDQTDILRAYHDLFLQGNAQGITFVFGSGDSSGLGCPQPGYFDTYTPGRVFRDVPGTSIWSDDPAVTSVGGTNLETTYDPGALTSRYVGEDADSEAILGPIDPFGTGNVIANARWGSGGGASVVFAKPRYQQLVDTHTPMRSDPDVAMQMGGCPEEFNAQGNPIPVLCHPNDSAVIAFVGGLAYGFIGTSAAAPEFAGLLAVLEQSRGNLRLGNANWYIYRLASTGRLPDGRPVYHEGIPGYNGIVCVKGGVRGYNPMVGVGTPIGVNFLDLPQLATAGDPQTRSNP